MATRNSKTSFSGEELTRIISLVRQLEMADRSKQKGIRNKLRGIGLYWSEVASGMSYTVDNLRLLFEMEYYRSLIPRRLMAVRKFEYVQYPTNQQVRITLI